MIKLAIFDFDGTLYRGFSINNFIKHLARINNHPWAFKEEKEIVEDYSRGLIDYEEGTERIYKVLLQLLKGLKKDYVYKEIGNFLNEEKGIFPWVDPLFEYLKRNDFEIIIISASIKPIIDVVTKSIKADRSFSSELKMRGNFFSGEVKKILYRGEKVAILKDVLAKAGLIKFSVGFGDSMEDAGMLFLTDFSFVLNCRQPEMLKMADNRGWHVVDVKDVSGRVKQILENIVSNLK